MMEAEKSPAGEGGASEERTMSAMGLRSSAGINTGTAGGMGSLPECPARPRCWQDVFPEHLASIACATDRRWLLRAVARFACAAMLLRVSGGTYNDLTRHALATEACQRVRMSPAARSVRPAEVARMVVGAEAWARRRVAR